MKVASAGRLCFTASLLRNPGNKGNMACTSQSAVEYVRGARLKLVRALKGLTVIVENLYQKEVFSEEEVSKIKTASDDFDKTREIVDSVIKKGEAACYEFLRIIDITRKRSTERPPSFLEITQSDSSSGDKFDLNYWISCFSFKDDTNMDVTYLQGPKPCHRYQQKLKFKAQKISERSWTRSKAVLFNKQTSLSYTSLVLDTQGQASASKIKKSKIKKSRKLRTKKLKAYIPEDKPGASPSELLKTYERKILLVGKPGTGKTAVVHQMLKLWSEKDNRDLDYMFYFDMRETPNITEVHKLEDLLFTVFCEPDEGKDEVLEDIKNNADSVTIIFDGVPDVPSTSTQSAVMELIQKTLLLEAKIIITCRPEVESADFLLDWDCLRVEVKGFSEQGIREYLSKNLSEDHFNKVLCNLELFSLCHVPMYALMVVACFSFEGSDFSPHPCTVTEIYLNILHVCNQRNVCQTTNNDSSQCNAILSLAETAFLATEGKNVNLMSPPQIDRCANLGFLNRLLIQAGPVLKKPLFAFLHYTIQEFFAALWLLKDPERTRSVVQQCPNDNIKHMKHLVPFLCGLLNEKNTDLLQCLFTSQQLRETSGWFFKHLVTTFVDCSDTEDCEIDLLFLCQCLYESQSAEACIFLLDKLDYCLDLSGETLDPQQCFALSYVISQSKERKIQLDLENTTVSKQGMKPLLGCLSKFQRTHSLSWQLWTICLLSEAEVDYISLLHFAENQLHLSVNSQTQLYDRARKVLQKSAKKVKVCLHWDHRTSVYQSVQDFLLQCLPNIHSLSFFQSSENLSDQTKFLMNLITGAAEREQQTGEKTLQRLSSVCRYQTFIFNDSYKDKRYKSNILLDLCSHVKEYQTKTGLSVLPSLQSVFSAPAVWFIDLSERKTSILLEVLKLQPEKKQVELTDCSHEESEVRSLLQCLPYISQLSSVPDLPEPSEETRFFRNLFCAAAESEMQKGETILELLSVCRYKAFPLKQNWGNFLMDLYSYQTEVEFSLLPLLQSVFSAPAFWSINLSERKTSILLEVLKLQSEKKRVELTGCSHEESEVRSLLQCLPYISQLSIYPRKSDLTDQIRFFVNLFCAAAEREQQTGEKILELVASVCTYQTFPYNVMYMNNNKKNSECNFLLDLYSHVKDYQTKTGLSVLPSLQSVFQSAPAVWSIKLSERKTSILLEVLKLQPEKKQVELTDCSHEESEVRSFLQCLPYISQLSVDAWWLHEAVRLFVSLFCAAAEREQQTGEKILELLASVCTYQTFSVHDRYMDDEDRKHQCDFLLDLCSHLKDYETKTGLSVLPSLQSVFSAPAVWFIKLSERKTSILLEVLKLQPEKKQVELTDCSHEESEVRSLLQCLPYISQLRIRPESSEEIRIFMDLFIAAAKREQQKGEKMLELLASVCTNQTFIFDGRFMNDYKKKYSLDFLLDLCSHVKDYQTKTGLSVLPSLQSVFQSAPAVWSIKLSERKTSILLEVLKLQPEKKRVELTDCSHEESEVRSLLQCLPYISQLRVDRWSSDVDEAVRLFVSLFCAAAEREQQTGEKILQLLASVCTYQTFPLHDRYISDYYQSDFLLDLYSHVKEYQTKTGLSVLPSLQSVFQSAPAVWSINLIYTDFAILLEVLKLQPEKKQVELRVWPEDDEESEVRSLLQCLPYISQLSVDDDEWSDDEDRTKFFVSLFCAAAEREQQTGEKILELLASVGIFDIYPFNVNDDDVDDLKKHQCDFLLDLYSHVKEYQTKTGLSVLPSLQSVFSAPAIWFMKLSERKTSILLEVLKLQPEKKRVELTDCSHEESEVRSFLQCLPYISQLSVDAWWLHEAVRLFVSLFCAAAEREQQTGEKILELLASVGIFDIYPFNVNHDDDDLKKYQSDFLLDLYSHVKEYQTKTGLSVLPSLQSVFQSAPAVWSINLIYTDFAILLEVLKLQPEKKQVELRGCSHEESEVRSLLQCLPYISQLSVDDDEWSDDEDRTKFFVSLFCAAAEREQQTGEKILQLLASVGIFDIYPFNVNHDDDDDLKKYQCDFLLDLCSHVKEYQTKTGLSVLPSLQSVFSAPAVWSIKLSERKTSILLEVLKLQPEKKQVELTDCSHEESEVRSFLQCLPYISQLRVDRWSSDVDEAVRLFVSLFCAAAEREQQTGEKILELLASVCTYQTFPLHDRYISDYYQSDFLLDLYSHVKEYQTKTGLSVLPSLQSVFQSAPAVWSINLIYTDFAILLEVLKLQPEKKQVELRVWPEDDEESEVRSLLQCLPYISQLSCGPEFFQSVCTSMSVRSREESQQLESLLQLLGFQLLLTGELPRKSCWSVGRVLRLCGSKVDLILTPSKMSARGGALLFRHTTQLHRLRLSIDMSLLLSQWVRRGRAACRLAVEELSLEPKKARPSHRVLLRAVSSLASLLRYWTVGLLDLTETCIPAQGLIALLLHDGPLTVKLNEESFQQLLSLLHETQDKDLTLSFLSKVGGDLTSCCLSWELLHYLLQQPSAQTITVNLRKNLFLQEETTRLLPFLDRIVFKRPSPSFVMTAIRELYRAHDSHAVPSLLRSLGHVINLSCRELDSVDCAALIFILKHGDRVRLNLLWTSIPAEGVESILLMLDNVSHLSVDRNQLLRFIHCCAACDVQQEAASGLLRTLQHSLDLSCSSCVELPEEDQTEPLSLTADDCRAVSTILTQGSRNTQLDLRDCEVEDSVLDLLFPVLHRVRLRVSKTVLLQLLCLVPVNSERDTVRRAVSLCTALGGELDLSHSTLDQRVCGALVQMLDSCDGLTELDLSHCQLTDQLLLPLITHLHKVQVLDLSHNQITDASTDVLLQLLSINPSIHSVRLFSNNIVHRAAFKEHTQFEIW
uniref:NACHT domain-containing protein n=2 Tax=Oreochromis aureus TaxID=47969 RepID=A0AAZ1X3K1_OREAU